MNIILFDDPQIRQSLLPLTFTRPVAALRIGILTIAEKWEKYINSGLPQVLGADSGIKYPKSKIPNPQLQRVSFLTENYLQKKFPLNLNDENILINGAVCPN
ncbi:MAG: glucose-1-phosphate thymidylyltransferase, partial [Cytophagales bacterium]|nr:glucose-1-phosphate thymidylyltransferase [Cytophagales bacterium]